MMDGGGEAGTRWMRGRKLIIGGEGDLLAGLLVGLVDGDAVLSLLRAAKAAWKLAWRRAWKWMARFFGCQILSLPGLSLGGAVSSFALAAWRSTLAWGGFCSGGGR